MTDFPLEDSDSIISDALKHNWRISSHFGYPYLAAPEEFVCSGWKARFIIVEYQGQSITVPNWVADETVRHTGIWKSPFDPDYS